MPLQPTAQCYALCTSYLQHCALHDAAQALAPPRSEALLSVVLLLGMSQLQAQGSSMQPQVPALYKPYRSTSYGYGMRGCSMR